MMPLLSIIVPVFNKEKYLISSIESILRQSFTDFELIIVNDGSTDSSPEKCDALAARDARIVLINQKNGGVSAARNAGLNAARGKYIGFVDCDDELESDMYALLTDRIQTYEADIAMCGVRKVLIGKENVAIVKESVTEVLTQNEMLIGLFNNTIPVSVYDKIFRADLAKSIAFTGAIYEDMFYNFNVVSKASKIIRIADQKYNYILRVDSESMGKFGKKYMNIADFSNQMLSACQHKEPEVLEAAIMFDFIAHISLLNLLILSDPTVYAREYELVENRLRSYRDFAKGPNVRQKHKFAVNLFLANANLYRAFLRVYCQFFDNDVLRRTR